MVGKKFGKLTVVAKSGSAKERAMMWECQCECGNIVQIRSTCLRSGHTKSCGCLKRDAGEKRRKKITWEEIPCKYPELGMCHICTSHSLRHGYPQLNRNGKGTNMSRIIYEETYGELKQDEIVRHKCDTPGCINPEHLERGTHADNVHDMFSRGRANTANAERSGRAKISWDIVTFIRIDTPTAKAMGFLLPKAKSISSIADVQDCGVPSPLLRQDI